MTKIERLIITILYILLGIYLLYPTLKWNKLIDEEDKRIAQESNVYIRDYALSKVRDVKERIEKESEDADLLNIYPEVVEVAKEIKIENEVWNKDALLSALDAGASYRLEKRYRDKYLSLKKLSSKVLNLGLDLRGGLSILLEADVAKTEERLGSSLSQAQIEEAIRDDIELLRRRVDEYGVSEVEIRTQGNDQIVIDMPGTTDPERVNSLLKNSGSLAFMLVDEQKSAQLSQEISENRQKFISEDNKFINQEYGENTTAYGVYSLDEYGIDVLTGAAVLSEEYKMDASYIQKVEVSKDNVTGQPTVNFTMSQEGGDLFYNITSKNINKPLAVVFDGKIKNIATIRAALSTNVQVSGFNQSEAEELSITLKSSNLPVDLKVISSMVVGASLGEDTISMTLKSIIIGLCILALFMIVYYRLAGLVSVLMLSLNMFMIVAVLNSFGFTLSLTSIAGIILTIGMAADSSIIVFERIKEELSAGLTALNAVSESYRKARWTILDANITTMIAALVLSMLGSTAVKGFANTLAIGIVSTLLTMLFTSHLIFDLFVKSSTKKIYIGAVLKNGVKKIKIIVTKYLKVCVVISSILLILGLIFFFLNGFNKGVDFESGLSLNVSIPKENVAIEDVRSALLSTNSRVQRSGAVSDSTFIIRSAAPDDEERTIIETKIVEELKNAFGDVDVISSSFIGAKFSSSLVTTSLFAIAIALIGILIYIWLRFQFSFSIAAVLTLIHDVLLLLSFIVIFRIEISSITIAAILTIIGYSLNNTIVIFDRIKENIKIGLLKDLDSIVDLSITQSIKRTLFSSLTTLSVIIPMGILVMNQDIKMFSLVFSIGILIGIYSSTYVAANILRLLSFTKKRVLNPMMIAHN